MLDYQQEFIQYAIQCEVLKFGKFSLKSGRSSPYFFNTGLFNTGEKLRRLGAFYAQALLHSGLQVDVLYGPAYKGIPLVSSTAIAYTQLTGKDIPFAFNRKEQKDHGEGGNLVGSPLQDNVLILDDVITAGTSVRESVQIISQANATPCGVFIALDRQEKGRQQLSAVQEVQKLFEIPVISIISLKEIIAFLNAEPKFSEHLDKINAYQQQFGI